MELPPKFVFLCSEYFIIIAGAALLILAEFFLRIYWSLYSLLPYAVYWLILTAVFSLLTFFPWSKYSRQEERLMVQAFFAGIFIGLLVAVSKVIIYHEMWVFFNLIAEPIRTALFGMIVVWVVNRIEPVGIGRREARV